METQETQTIQTSNTNRLLHTATGRLSLSLNQAIDRFAQPTEDIQLQLTVAWSQAVLPHTLHDSLVLENTQRQYASLWTAWNLAVFFGTPRRNTLHICTTRRGCQKNNNKKGFFLHFFAQAATPQPNPAKEGGNQLARQKGVRPQPANRHIVHPPIEVWAQHQAYKDLAKGIRDHLATKRPKGLSQPNATPKNPSHAPPVQLKQPTCSGQRKHLEYTKCSGLACNMHDALSD
jgi:hypothetical protein